MQVVGGRLEQVFVMFYGDDAGSQHLISTLGLRVLIVEYTSSRVYVARSQIF